MNRHKTRSEWVLNAELLCPVSMEFWHVTLYVHHVVTNQEAPPTPMSEVLPGILLLIHWIICHVTELRLGGPQSSPKVGLA
jgi:hypothetical protein